MQKPIKWIVAFWLEINKIKLHIHNNIKHVRRSDLINSLQLHFNKKDEMSEAAYPNELPVNVIQSVETLKIS